MTLGDQQEFGLGILDSDIDDFLPMRPILCEPAKRPFRPWHKPRKQFIRRNQWCHEIGRLIETIAFPPDNRVLRYLSLPSEDMLDIHTLVSSLNEDLTLKYLGFFYAQNGSPDDQRMNLSEKAIKGLDRVDATSHIARDMLEDTGNRKSTAYKTLRAHAPYHVVNIDLCDHFAAPRRANAYACIDALHSIAEIQHEKAGGNSWLFFLTTRIQPDYFDVLHLRVFVAAIQANVNASEEFRAKLGEVFFQESDRLLQKLTDLAALLEKTDPVHRKDAGLTSDEVEALRRDAANTVDEDTFRKFFCVGFGKWLLSFLAASSPQTKVEMLPSYFYSVGSDNQDMLSLAFKCTPQTQPLSDPFNLVRSPLQAKAPISETRQGVQIVKAVSRLRDLDDLLENNPEQMELMVQETIMVLDKADYDTSTYREFATLQVGAPASVVV